MWNGVERGPGRDRSSRQLSLLVTVNNKTNKTKRLLFYHFVCRQENISLPDSEVSVDDSLSDSASKLFWLWKGFRIKRLFGKPFSLTFSSLMVSLTVASFVLWILSCWERRVMEDLEHLSHYLNRITPVCSNRRVNRARQKERIGIIFVLSSSVLSLLVRGISWSSLAFGLEKK